MVEKYNQECELRLTKGEIQIVLDSMSLMLERHYNNYDIDLPEEQIAIIVKLTDERQKFAYCRNCNEYYYRRWTDTECRDCPKLEEE